jgi:DNA-binding LacI/PurR family transcriptional regulator
MNKTKYEAIALTLEDNIKNNIYSEKLPPVRSLVVEFGVANPTMNKALKILVKKGLIIPSGPKGNIISKKNVIRPKTRNVAIFYNTDSIDVKNSPILNELSIKAEADNYNTLFMHALAPDVFNDDDFWSSNWVDGYIFISSTLKKELAYKLHKKSVPFVVANRLPPECGVHWVDFNIKKTLRTLVRASIKAGQNRIMLAYSKISLPSYVAYIKQLWNEILKEHSMECSGILLHLGEDNNRKNSSKCASKFVESQSNSLILIGIDPVAVESKLMNMGLRINEDYSLSYRAHHLELDSDNFSYALVSYKSLADETWNLFKKVVENPEIEAQNILIDEDIHINKNIKRREMLNAKTEVRSEKYVLAEV